MNIEEINLNRKNIKSILEYRYKEAWLKLINCEPKMRTYCKFKCKFYFEDYLMIKNVKHRTSMTKLRISAHRLAIETGRYCQPVRPLETRTCNHCINVIEDEYHFLMECTAYDKQRKILFNKIHSKCEQFIQLNSQDKFLYLLTSGYNVAKEVAVFICDNLP